MFTMRLEDSQISRLASLTSRSRFPVQRTLSASVVDPTPSAHAHRETVRARTAPSLRLLPPARSRKPHRRRDSSCLLAAFESHQTNPFSFHSVFIMHAMPASAVRLKVRGRGCPIGVSIVQEKQ